MRIQNKLNGMSSSSHGAVTVGNGKVGRGQKRGSMSSPQVQALRGRIDNLDAMVSRIAATAERVVKVLEGGKGGNGAMPAPEAKPSPLVNSSTKEEAETRPVETAARAVRAGEGEAAGSEA